MSDDITSLWLARLRALTPTEGEALVDEMSEGEAKMVLLRLEHQLEESQDACLDYQDELKHYRETVVPYYREQARRGWWARIWRGSER